jgi:carboxyl-terminal processing protease
MFRAICTTVFLLIFLIKGYAQTSKTELSVGQRASLLIEVMNRNHCEPQVIDNVFSQKLFKAYLENVDPEKEILTKADVAKIKSFETLLDDQIKSKNIQFIAKVTQLVKHKLQQNDSLVLKITEKPINFSSKFTHVLTYDSLAANDAELKTRIQRNLKYKIFNSLYYSLLDTSTNTISGEYLDFEKLKDFEKTAREQVSERARKNTALELSDSELTEKYETLFLQTIAHLYDNHSDYFGTEGVLDFIQGLNPENEVFGFNLEENKKGEIVIGNLLPGGPAWNCGMINEGDVLLNFAFEGKKMINVVGGDIYEVDEIFQKEKGKNVSLTLRKQSKEIQTIKLSRETILLDNQTVRGFILEKKEKFGYINLPAFYSDSESEDQLGCANDVAKELIKMKDDNIKGLILDLRFNGGGSVKEALDLAGIFIDQGVFGAAKPQKGKTQLLKDPNRGSIYDDPMVVLVNQASASASEILAGILQDYNRAVIVGSTTFGKGVAQGIMPLDSFNTEPKYYAKATVWRVYAPSGRAIQHLGIKPDVALPSILDGLDIAEKNEAFSLNPTAIDRALIFNPEPKLPIATLQEKSKIRIDKNKSFVPVEKLAAIIKQTQETEKIEEELNWEVFCKNQMKLDGVIEPLEVESKTELFKIKVPAHDRERTKTDTNWNKLNEKLFKQITRDIYLEESLQILINLNE